MFESLMHYRNFSLDMAIRNYETHGAPSVCDGDLKQVDFKWYAKDKDEE